MKWSKKQKEFLKKNYEKGTKEYLCEKLGRSWNAIQLKASAMGIKRDDGSSLVDMNLGDIEDHMF